MTTNYIKLNELVGKIKQAYLNAQTNSTKAVLEDILPELAESEDERIRKALIDFFNRGAKYGQQTNGVYDKDIVAWLEKQGEQKSAEWHKGDEQNLNACLGYIPDEYLRRWLMDVIHIKYDKPTDKVETKFHKGQWIVWQDECYKVNYNGCGYELVDKNGLSILLDYGTIDENAHLWDVAKDAKNGDVLVASDDSIFLFRGVDDSACKYYAALTADNYIRINKEAKGGYWETSRAVYPATKEQRDTLMKAMADAGYTFDFDKKELKKIEKKFNVGDEIKTANEEPLAITKIDEKGYWSEDLFICDFDDAAKWELVEQKPSWSKEDWNYIADLISYFDGSSLQHNTPDVISWLKSLKERYTWKPSDEQLDALQYVYRNFTPSPSDELGWNSLKTLELMYHDLKKLREE